MKLKIEIWNNVVFMSRFYACIQSYAVLDAKDLGLKFQNGIILDISAKRKVITNIMKLIDFLCVTSQVSLASLDSEIERSAKPAKRIIKDR